ncbi:hypothetical protein [Rhodobacter lacus]|uniref:Uncharacterized protein n=1 Tax=Rhodobacter lacus TaxID=1641972 RepID=A0ABW5ABG7_9RHOB
MSQKIKEQIERLREGYVAFGLGFILGAATMASPAIAIILCVGFGADFVRRVVRG